MCRAQPTAERAAQGGAAAAAVAVGKAELEAALEATRERTSAAIGAPQVPRLKRSAGVGLGGNVAPQTIGLFGNARRR